MLHCCHAGGPLSKGITNPANLTAIWPLSLPHNCICVELSFSQVFIVAIHIILDYPPEVMILQNLKNSLN
jgi:hypothetical protein